ncbi:GNAT family N-acetyltransferase [Pseudomonas sp. COR18]|uniref:GNAT family N-acetyltransferase n=1 Tax=Pseudomonas sp. COR18 TaxID=3399680 RepID=UPI003AFFBE06
MSVPEAIESVEQYIFMWKVLAGDRCGADLSEQPGLSLCWADSPFSFWNAVFLNEQITDEQLLRERLRAGAAYLRARRQDGLVYVCEDYLGGSARQALESIAAEERLSFALDIMGMVGDLLPFEQSAGHPLLTFERVRDEVALQHYADINSEGYGSPLDAGRAGLAGSNFWKQEAFAFIGYQDGRPVSTAAAIVNRGQLYVALVATRPDAQRQGFGEATVRHALQAAHEATGLRRTTLHATDAGLPVYLRLGYHRTTRFITYGLAP